MGKNLEKSIGQKRKLWSVALCRHLFSLMLPYWEHRRKTPESEESWLTLAGFLLRPGFGAVNDPWRVGKILRLIVEKMQHKKVSNVRIAWWIFWRRICGGCDSATQKTLFTMAGAHVLPGMKHLRKGPSPDKQEIGEIWRLLASLERLSPKEKVLIGNGLIKMIHKPKDHDLALWGVSRIGARIPFGDTGQFVLNPSLTEEWIRKILTVEGTNKQGTINGLLRLGRKCTVRELNISEGLKEEVAHHLRALGAKEEQLSELEEVRAYSSEEQSSQFGETLPQGLVLL